MGFFKKVFNKKEDVLSHPNERISEKYRSFEDWYSVFKKTVAEENPQLAESENNTSLLDFMDHEPLKRAFRDGIEPEYLARKFAKQFDITKFVLG